MSLIMFGINARLWFDKVVKCRFPLTEPENSLPCSLSPSKGDSLQNALPKNDHFDKLSERHTTLPKLVEGDSLQNACPKTITSASSVTDFGKPVNGTPRSLSSSKGDSLQNALPKTITSTSSVTDFGKISERGGTGIELHLQSTAIIKWGKALFNLSSLPITS